MNSYTGPYKAVIQGNKKRIHFLGSKMFPACNNIQDQQFDQAILDARVQTTSEHPHFKYLHEIDDAIYQATNSFMSKRGANWTNLPLTTRMISSPGEVFAGQTLDYTTDTLPVELSWFGNDSTIFLSESSQFYLELRLLIDGIDRVYSIYNSFRKEPADYCHLSEFQHVEYEGKHGFDENNSMVKNLVEYLCEFLVENKRAVLAEYLTNEEIDGILSSTRVTAWEEMRFQDALSLLYKKTGDPCYKEFSLKHFGGWEEILLTEILGRPVMLTEYPLLQIPFYHNMKHDEQGNHVAENADFILTGARETIGAGTRITDVDALNEKAKVFNLPLEDYKPYMAMRRSPKYQTTSGFGMGWQRLTHWILKLPYIWDACHIPRGHLMPRP